jgi:glycosyltransferase involved in cell wall biosynthesis
VDVRPLVSVIIPVWRDWELLRGCLAALEAQTLPRDLFEIIVVDNDAIPLESALRPSAAIYVHHPHGFAYAARNAGISRAKGRFLAFTDADCLPDSTWLAVAVEQFEASGADLIAGRIELFSESPTWAALYEFAFAFRQERYVLGGAAATANLLVRANVIEHAGHFDDSLETAGDFEFCRRAVATGFRLSYCENAIVRHPARQRLAALLLKARRDSIGGWLLYCKQNPNIGLTGRVRFLLPYLKPRIKQWSQDLKQRDSIIRKRSQRFVVLALRLVIHSYSAIRLTRVVLLGHKLYSR